MNKKHIFLIIVFLLLIAVPLVITDLYVIHIFIGTYISSIVAIGTGLLLYAMMISLGQAGIMAIGSYASTLLTMRCNLSFWLALPLSGIISAVIGLIMGLPTLKLRGLYFFLITWAISEIVRLGIINAPSSLLGGHTGIPNVPLPDPILIPGLSTIEFIGKTPFYYLIFSILVLVSLVSYRLYVSHFGRVLYMISVSEDLARSLGVNVGRYKASVWTIACFFAGIAGSLHAHYYQLAATQFFTFWHSIYFVMMPTIGGSTTILGSITGAIFFTVIPEVFRQIEIWKPVIFGAALILTVFLLPGGLETLPRVIGRIQAVKRIQKYVRGQG
jgi:branched-chain amino acid transport system permease protein